ncbi:hypothetical protein PROFUN_14292 [Planoprotostelium fungivorum]|uniref:Uncharacterized protein n=1 Tax=Planoprotostelium fungivorum TaxID=1890364 RepID=A0A2P6N0K9_9EUKA|nr:hypothetical protein PROFUN_14292 [Planoprotostelium fungivorum]
MLNCGNQAPKTLFHIFLHPATVAIDHPSTAPSTTAAFIEATPFSLHLNTSNTSTPSSSQSLLIPCQEIASIEQPKPADLSKIPERPHDLNINLISESKIPLGLLYILTEEEPKKFFGTFGDDFVKKLNSSSDFAVL